MGEIAVRLARSDESEEISALALRSKAYWGYSAEFLEACRSELTYSTEACGSGRMWVATDGNTILGFGMLGHVGGTERSGEDGASAHAVRQTVLDVTHGRARLDALFVEPAAIGTGLGRRLLRFVLDRAAELGYSTVELDAEPGAESFYRHFGAERIGSSPSGSIQGRSLPRMLFTVQPSTDT